MSSEREVKEMDEFKIGQWVWVSTTACRTETQGYIASLSTSCIGVRFDGSLDVEQLVPRSQIVTIRPA